MDFFGFGTPSELTTPIGVVIKASTDSLRISPDWTKNLEICDQINLHKENIDPAIKAIRRRIMDSDHQTVNLALLLLETCMKNCGVEFARHFDSYLMNEVVNVILKENKGLRNKEEALRLVQQWGRAFESRKNIFPIFFDTFMNLKARGVSFPKEEDAPTASYDRSASNNSQNGNTKPPSTPQKSSSTSQSSAQKPSSSVPVIPEQEEDEFIRLQQDLSVVMEKVRLCREILMVSPGIEQDEALADIIGFLEACRDRMVDVIEVGTQGLLGEDLFALCLKVNDSIAKTLDAERNGILIPVDDEEEKTALDSTDNLLDISPVGPGQKAVPGTKPSLEEEIFGAKQKSLPATTLTPSTTATSASAATVAASDPFGGAFGDYPALPAVSSSTAGAVPVIVSSPVTKPQSTPTQTIKKLPPPPSSAGSAAASNANTSVNPFDIYDAQSTTAPPPPPAAAADDFDALFGISPAKSDATNANSAAKGNELEDFFASLDVSHN